MDTLSRLVDAELAVEKERVRCDVRLSHLKLQGRTCHDTEEVRDRLLTVEDWIQSRIASLIKDHPTYPWFSRVKGAGLENIPKCIGPLRIKAEKGYRKDNETKKIELVDLPYAQTISAVWMFTGFGLDGDHHVLKRKKGEILTYNSELRAMWWRLGSSLLKAGLRQKCSVCGELMGKETFSDPEKHTCKDATFTTVAISKFAKYYLDQKDKYQQLFLKVVPATKLPKDKDGNKYEPSGIISEGHLHMRALRKMIKLFQACLVLVWWEAEGIPPTNPYAIDKLGHNSFIDPWSMCDR